MMYLFCEQHAIPHEKCGKVVVATNKDESLRLESLRERGIANGIRGLRKISGDELHEREPFVLADSALLVPETGIVNYTAVTEKMASLFCENGGKILLGTSFIAATLSKGTVTVQSSQGDITCGYLVNCGGLYSDRVCRACGIDPEVIIAPFRGEYYKLSAEAAHKVNHLIYPVPDPNFPFLGVHFTRTIDGMREAGPNAVLAFARKGYSYADISARDMMELFLFPGFYRLAAKHSRMAVGEYYRSLSKSRFLAALQKLIPDIRSEELQPGGSGVRAQALLANGALCDDFIIRERQGMIHVLNAPSPAATASLSIGDTIAAIVRERLGERIGAGSPLG